MEGVQSEIVGEATNEQEWNGVGIVGPTIKGTEGRPGQCKQEQ